MQAKAKGGELMPPPSQKETLAICINWGFMASRAILHTCFSCIFCIVWIINNHISVKKAGQDVIQCYPLHKMPFSQYPAPSVVLEWLENEECYSGQKGSRAVDLVPMVTWSHVSHFLSLCLFLNDFATIYIISKLQVISYEQKIESPSKGISIHHTPLMNSHYTLQLNWTNAKSNHTVFRFPTKSIERQD